MSSGRARAASYGAACVLLVATLVAGQLSLIGHQLQALQRLLAVVLAGLAVMYFAGPSLSSLAVAKVRQFDAWLSVRPSRATTVLATFIVGYFCLWCAVSFARHYLFHSSYDLGIMDQVAWNSSHGRPFARSIEVDNDLGDHVRPYLTALGLLYMLVASPYVLLAFQHMVLALAALPLYRLATRHLGSPAIGLLLAFCLLAYPPLGFVSRFDLHIEALSVPLLFLAWDRIERRKLASASVFLALTLLCKENLGITVAAVGLFAALVFRLRTFGITWSVAGVAYSLTALFIVIPAFRGEPSDTLTRYEWIAGSSPDIGRAALAQPVLLARKVFAMENVLTLLQSFAPLGFVPLAGWPALLPAAPTYLYNFLASSRMQGSIYAHYMVPAIPFVFIAALSGMRRFPTGDAGSPVDTPRRDRSAAAAAVVMTLAVVASWVYENPVTGNAAVVLGRATEIRPMETATGTAPVVPLVWPNDAAIREGLRRVPDAAGLLTTTYYAPHLSHRRWIEMLPKAPVASLDSRADALFMNVRDQRSWTCNDYFEVVRVAAMSGFGVEYEKQGVLVLRKGRVDAGRLRAIRDSWPGCT
jgi:uncharacterized membrane protein